MIKQLPSKIRQMVLLDPSSIKKTKDLKAFGSKMDTKSLKVNQEIISANGEHAIILMLIMTEMRMS